MVINREQDVCHGRGFSEIAPGGWLENFFAWVTRVPVGSPVSKSTGGPGYFIIDDQSAAGTDPYIVISQNTAANIASNENRFDVPHKIFQVGLVTATAGEVFVKTFLWWDVTTHVGYGQWDHKLIATLDDADFVYDFRGGPDFFFVASRIGTAWDHSILGDWVGDADFVEPASVVGVTQANVTAGTNVVIQLDTGQAANFTEGNFYFIYDFRFKDLQVAINYVKVSNVDSYADQLTIKDLNNDMDAGSVIGAYVHRFVTGGNNKPGIASLGRIPYVSFRSSETSPQFIMTNNFEIRGIGILISRENSYLSTMKPDDLGRFAVQRWGVTEDVNGSTSASATAEMNRGYGPAKDMYITNTAGIAQMLDGRLINGQRYIYATTNPSFDQAGGADAILVPDFDSTT